MTVENISYSHGGFRNFVGFNSTITTSSEHVTNGTFLAVTNLWILQNSRVFKPVTLNQNPTVMFACF